MEIRTEIAINFDSILDKMSSYDKANLLESIYESCNIKTQKQFIKEYVDDDWLIEACKYRIKTDCGCFADSCKNAKIHITLKL